MIINLLEGETVKLISSYTCNNLQECALHNNILPKMKKKNLLFN